MKLELLKTNPSTIITLLNNRRYLSRRSTHFKGFSFSATCVVPKKKQKVFAQVVLRAATLGFILIKKVYVPFSCPATMKR